MNEFNKTTRENEELRSSLKQSSTDMLRLEESCSTLIKTKDSLQADLNEATEKVTQLDGKVEDLQKKVGELELLSYEQLGEGFRLAQE